MVEHYAYGFVAGVVPAALLALCLVLKRSINSVIWE